MSGSWWKKAGNEQEWVKNKQKWVGVDGSEWEWREGAWECIGVSGSTVQYKPFYHCVLFLSCHIHTQKESTFCDCLTVKELLAQDKRNI